VQGQTWENFCTQKACSLDSNSGAITFDFILGKTIKFIG
jgi:hypothetical protein